MRAQNLQLQLETLATKGAVACDRFEEYQNGRGVASVVEAAEAFDRISAMGGKQTYLRQQIEMRVNGSKDRRLHVPRLVGIALRPLPGEAPG
eukprot:6941525-Prymnesium_polylepis.1